MHLHKLNELQSKEELDDVFNHLALNAALEIKSFRATPLHDPLKFPSVTESLVDE